MRRLAFASIIAIAAVAAAACQRAKDDKSKSDQKTTTATPKGNEPGGAEAQTMGRAKQEQLPPPFDIKTPPGDAIRRPSGLIYKIMVKNDAGAAAKRNDIVLINYTGWRQTTGETFYSNRSQGKPMPLNLSTSAPGFTEAMQIVKKGEKAMLWIPPAIGTRGTLPPQANADTLVYEVEVVDIKPAPEIPTDLKEPAPNAQSLKSGVKYIVLRPGTGKEKARSFDTVSYHFTSWDSDGRQLESTETRGRPAKLQAFRQTAMLEEVLTSLTAGERIRLWADAEKVLPNPKNTPGAPKGLLTYELELLQIEKATTAPPPVPPDVAKAPADAKKTEKGVFYKVLKAGKGGPKPKPSDTVRVHYTGWTTDGRMFDSSILRNEPTEFPLGGVIAGWTDGIPVMSVGDKVRFWIPEELAYKGSPGKPQGMLVFDVELLEIKDPAKDAHGAHGAHGDDAPAGIPAPPDVTAPPKDAKKSPKGVSYKVLTAGKGGPKPTAEDTVKVHYTGWTTDGKMFDSSVTRGQPAEFPLRGVIAGWTDAIPVMSVGDKVRFWIPEEMAYKGSPGKPQGMLVFDVELLEIKSSK
jgi:FKBP-type peptidyl-prolyl cis-trans isomerase